jgi:hypothetical protein
VAVQSVLSPQDEKGKVLYVAPLKRKKLIINELWGQCLPKGYIEEVQESVCEIIVRVKHVGEASEMFKNLNLQLVAAIIILQQKCAAAC